MRRKIVILFMALLPLVTFAQFNVDMLVINGRNALYYEDYVLSIQYFNRAIDSKPYIYEPWYYRGLAKYYLDDYFGAENDCTEAIKLNPYIAGIYELRGLCRIRQEKYREAIDDYGHAIKYDPAGQNYWFNRALCRKSLKEYGQAHEELDSMIKRWSNYAAAYSVQAEVYMMQKDTAQAVKWLDRGLKVDPYNGDVWMVRASISMQRGKWRDAEQQLSKVIHLKPKMAANYVNRALSRLNTNNLRGAMSDYDAAIDLDPNNFLAHYNRGLLRVQVGDDNRAISDFDYVLKMEPGNLMATFNRAVLLQKTGNLKAAIRDYSKVIRQYPNFWTGLHYRAACYRGLGMSNQAELDEFRIFKAQMNKHIGVQPRWSKNKIRLTRKKSEVDMNKYNQIVVADDSTVERDREYASVYRGHVQNHKVDIELMPMYHLSFYKYDNVINASQAYDKDVDSFNQKENAGNTVYVACNAKVLDEQQTHRLFAKIDTFTNKINVTHDMAETKKLLLLRAVAYSVSQNFDGAISDLTTCLSIDSLSPLAYWQRAICQFMQNNFNASQGMDTKLRAAKTMADFDRAIALSPQNAYIYYDRGNIYAANKDYAHAADDYTMAIKLNRNMAEAYYNRGLVRVYMNKKADGIKDLSRAGELGIYSAYSVIKQYSK